MDAVRTRDGAKVALKRVRTDSEEYDIALYMSSPGVRYDPRNHCVSILDIIHSQNSGNDESPISLLVMPQLVNFHTLPYRRLGELAEAFRQYIKGLDFMHKNGVIHGDACYYNLMMDATEMIPQGIHMMEPVASSDMEWNERSTIPFLKYYITDFGLSEMPEDMDELWFGFYGQDRSVPEHKLDVGFNPIKVDTYQLGNVLVKMTKTYDGLEGIQDLAKTMTRKNPNSRISLKDALQWLMQIPGPALNQRVWKKTCSNRWRDKIEFEGYKCLL
ncbi:hypothetical protein DXG01_000634 [Tephrocybe rancida]|nr:hypothetical protein DXG01_000634 [Tephrocybe rancida]